LTLTLDIIVFDSNPIQVAISLSIYKDSSVFNSDNTNLIIIYNLYENKLIKFFYSFTEIQSIAILGSAEEIILAAGIDGLYLYSLRGGNEKFYFKASSNPLFADNDIKPSFKIILPMITYELDNVIRIKKNILNNRIYCVTNEGLINILEYIENNESPLKNHNEIRLRSGSSKIIDINYSKLAKLFDVLYLLTNIELFKIKVTGKNEYEINSISNESITSFDVSDSGHILTVLNDMTIKIIDENNFSIIFQTVLSDVSPNCLVDRIYWSNLICKAENNKLVRKNLLANFYLINTKNEFFIFDLSQKTKADLKV
jgi:hypothetical protein